MYGLNDERLAARSVGRAALRTASKGYEQRTLRPLLLHVSIGPALDAPLDIPLECPLGLHLMHRSLELLIF